MSFHDAAHVRGNHPAGVTGRPVLRRKCVCGRHGDAAECTQCRTERRRVQRHGATREQPGAVPDIVHRALRSPWQALRAGHRGSMESWFGHDFSAVRVHTDGTAAASARAIRAQAYTVGNDVVFDRGRYAPDSTSGRRLLAHELTHVVQQQGAPAAGPLTLDDPASPAEREAERLEGGPAVLPATSVGRSVQRRPPPDLLPPKDTGPPVNEVPLPPRCSIIWKGGKWSWKCEGLPKIGSTPEIPLDPRDIPDRVRDLIPKGGGSGGPRVIPLPPSPGSELPENWFEKLCEREPNSPLCLPSIGRNEKPDEPSGPGLLARPVGVFWTSDVLFEHDQPGRGAGEAGVGTTDEGENMLNGIGFILKNDPTLRVRLVGHASAEGTPAHNLELSKRRVQSVYRRLEQEGLGWQVSEPVESDGRTDGCTRLEFGVWACGAAMATPDEARAEERKVGVTFLRNPPLPSGPLKLTPPELLRSRPSEVGND